MATSPPLFPILPHSSDDGEMPMALDLIAPQNPFVKSKSFEQDIIVLSMTYVLAENPELKRLADLIVAIHDKDEEDQLTVVLNICARFSIQLAFASEAEAGETITHLIKTVEEISRINLEGNSQSDPLQALNCAVDEIVKFKFSPLQLIRNDNSGLSIMLNVIIGAGIAALDIVKEASALVPIPCVQTAVEGVVTLLNVAHMHTDNDEMRQITTTAGQFVVSCAVACSDQSTELSDELKRALSQFTRTLEQITEDCDDISQCNAISPDLQQNAHKDALQGIRKRLDDAMKFFQNESQIPDIEDLSTKFDDATSNDLPSHRRYLTGLTINCLPEDSSNPALQGMSVIIHGLGEEDTVWTKTTATTWKYDGKIRLHSGMDGLTLRVQSEYAGDVGHVAFSSDELATFMVVDGNLELERDFVRLEEHTPLLQLTVTVVNASAGLGLSTESIQVGAHMLEGMQDPRMFTAKLGELAERPESLDAFGDLFLQQFDETSSEEDINRAVLAYKLAAVLTPSDNANFAMYVNDLGISVGRRFQLSERLEDINEAISMTEVAIAYTPEGDTDMPAWLNNLGISFQTRFERNGDLADIASAISIIQRAVELTPEGHASMPARLSNLGNSFATRFERNGDLADIASAISTQQRAVELTPEGHASMPARLSTLGNAFQVRFKRNGDLADIASAISMKQRAIELTPEGHADMPARLNNLGNSFATRFERIGDLADIAHAISTQQMAVELTTEGHADMPSLLANLGISFLRRFEHNGDLADIASAISMKQRAIELTPEGHADMPARLNNLGNSFATRFERIGDLADIAHAISTQQRAVELTPEGHADMPGRLNNLGISFLRRFERNGDLADIASAISMKQRAIELTPEGHAEMPGQLNNLGNSFQARFERNGDLADIASAISMKQRAIELTPEGHASMPTWLNNLGNAFESRFERIGDLADIAHAISTQQRAVELTPEGHADMPGWLNNLGISFLRRFERNGDLADIASAISMKQRAVELTPEGHAEMPGQLNNLGNSFQARFEHNGDLADIASAISTQQRAVELTPEGHASMPARLSNLGNAFQSRFEHNGDLADIASAISTQQRAVELTPEGHADMPVWLNNLGNAFHSQFRTTLHIQHMRQAISIFSQSATQVVGDPSVRLSAAHKWALLSRHAADSPQSLRAFSVAIHLLPQVAGLERTIRKRHQTLVEACDITASATAAAIDDNQLEMAVSWLEQGRCLVWNQLAHLRTPIDDLHAYYPSLAARFLHVARALEVSGSRQEQNIIFSKENAAQMISFQEEANTHTHLAKEWDKLLQEIRSIPDFEDFLFPLQASKLLSRLPLDGPIIIFNIDESRCDALALISGRDSPFHIPLPTFSFDNAIQLRDEMHKYLSNHRVRQQREVDRDGDRLHAGGDTSMHKVLRDLWEHVAKPILDALGYSPNNSDPPRIWWCPTGPLSFLPIHAAGIYSHETGTAGPCVSDFVVSSYTPSVSALLDKINVAPNMDDIPTNLLIVSQPLTPGLNPIPGAKREAYAIKDMVGPSLLLENASATVSKVKEEMKSHHWVHFACHAIQDAVEPLKSGVELHDGRLELSEMMKQTLPDAELAFLSACQTSTGNQDLSDEVVHLAAGMLAAGYRSVVGTMWSIKDVYGPDIAKDFYLNILGTNLEDRRRLDSGKAAGALHRATQNLRKKIGDTEEALLIWVPYVHFGV